MNKQKCPASCTDGGNHKNHTSQLLGSTHRNLEYVGYIGAIVAILFFGSNFVPVKKYETGDGKRCSCQNNLILIDFKDARPTINCSCHANLLS